MNYTIFKGHHKQAEIFIEDDMAAFAFENEEGHKLLKECFRLLKEFMDKYGNNETGKAASDPNQLI